MGIRFDLGSTNIVAYLSSPLTTHPPRLTQDQLRDFLRELARNYHPSRPRLISSSHDWVLAIQAAAEKSLRTIIELDESCLEEDGRFLREEVVKQLLSPLAATLGSYDLYILPVGTWRDSDVLDRFAHEAARIPGHGILVLIPDYYEPDQNVEVLNPSHGISEALRNRAAWPGAIFLLRTGEASFRPIDDARKAMQDLTEVMDVERNNLESFRRVLSQKSPTRHIRRRLLHLSDLHFGTRRAQVVQSYVQAQLTQLVGSVSQIVITGDLFDQPRRRHAQEYRNFADQLKLMSNGRSPIVVPGNHDQRVFGNSIVGLGRRLRELADLRWQEVVVDRDGQTVFLCFDSSRSGNLARGEIGEEQLIRVATQFDIENAAGQYAGFLIVAVLHHHPYRYTDRERPIVDPRGWVGREDFLELIDADRFLRWCASRGVNLILHGHKHVPRLIVDHLTVAETPHSYRDWKSITTVGCGSTLGANGTYMSYNVIEWEPDASMWNVEFMIDRGDASGFFSSAVRSEVLA